VDFIVPYNRHRAQTRTETDAVYQAMREAIVTGRLKCGVRLPSTRELAASLSLSRGTVNQVYEMLAAEGYVEATIGRGTFVAYDGISLNLPSNANHAEAVLSEWGQRIVGTAETVRRRNSMNSLLVTSGNNNNSPHFSTISFTLQGPDMDTFPMTEWKRIMYAQVREVYSHGQLGEHDAAGYLPLREAIARMLGRTRGIQADAADIAIVHGSMQAIFLLVHLLLQPGDRAVVENPGYGGTLRAMMSAGVNIVTAEIDESGLIPHNWDDVKLLLVTAGRQFPTGAVLSMTRRQHLLRWAVQRQSFIVEDDYDSEFRHRSNPVEPLKSLDTEGRVVYIGSFSKSMPFALRMGYVVLPTGLRHAFQQAQQMAEPHASGLVEQQAMAAFLQGGGYEKHLRRMKRIYARRRELLQASLSKGKLADRIKLFPADAGLHLFAEWQGSMEQYKRFLSACKQAGVEWTDGASYYVTDPRPSACFGFAHLNEERIELGVQRMHQVLKQLEL